MGQRHRRCSGAAAGSSYSGGAGGRRGTLQSPQQQARLASATWHSACCRMSDRHNERGGGGGGGGQQMPLYPVPGPGMVSDWWHRDELSRPGLLVPLLPVFILACPHQSNGHAPLEDYACAQRAVQNTMQ